MNPTVRGVFGSWTIWVNVGLAALGSLELAGSHLTTLFGPKVAAAIMLIGSLVNVALRVKTTQSLTEKGTQSLAAKSDG